MKTNWKIKGILLAAVLCLIFSSGAGVYGGDSRKVTLSADLDRGVLLADEKQTAYIKIALTGFEMDRHWCRSPVNIAIVIDKSGSMSGEKIQKAKEAAIMAIELLNSDDIVSVVTYDSTVNVVVPATKVSDKKQIIAQIHDICANGSTALYAGVQKGAQELRKFLSDNRVNRMILLSDGLANVGPQSPEALGEAGQSLIKDGISVTTIGLGLGYNEDLMTQLAYKSDGSHYFAEKACELADIFNQEFDRALSVVAQEVNINIYCGEGVRPVRLLGRSGHIEGQKVNLFINQLYSEHEKYAILEVEVSPAVNDSTRKIANVKVSYENMNTGKTDKLSDAVQVYFSKSEDKVEKSINKDVTVSVVEQIATERNELAVSLRDKGKVEEARKVLLDNSSYLKCNAVRFESEELKEYGAKNKKDADNLDERNWAPTRKSMRYAQSVNRQQQ